MPSTKPVCSSAAHRPCQVEQKATEVGLCDVNQTVSITENFDGVGIDHLKTLPASEVHHRGQPTAAYGTTPLHGQGFAICTQKDITVMSHAEDMEISPWDYRLAEDIETVRNCWLSRVLPDPPAHVPCVHRGALDAIRWQSSGAAPVTVR